METEKSILQDIIEILSRTRIKAYVAINTAMVETYWLIGKRIIEEEQKGNDRAQYGTFLIPELSKQLTAECGKGFSIANLKNFRQFYQSFPKGAKSYEGSSLLSWSHYRLIMRV